MGGGGVDTGQLPPTFPDGNSDQGLWGVVRAQVQSWVLSSVLCRKEGLNSPSSPFSTSTVRPGPGFWERSPRVSTSKLHPVQLPTKLFFPHSQHSELSSFAQTLRPLIPCAGPWLEQCLEEPWAESIFLENPLPWCHPQAFALALGDVLCLRKREDGLCCGIKIYLLRCCVSTLEASFGVDGFHTELKVFIVFAIMGL